MAAGASVRMPDLLLSSEAHAEEGEPMLITLMSLSMALAVEGPQVQPPPLMRVAYADLDFADPAQSRRFTERVAVATGRFCADHRDLVTPSHVRERRYCERSMGAAAVRALPREQWRLHVRASTQRDRGAPAE